ncbi:gamma-tubulin complex component 6-like [Ptychodera flava]|uniref:gamma-tubulin complex component 6-like n=1 Tax=Ptychodera flava TaxID=63121 RepID=UPI003969E631
MMDGITDLFTKLCEKHIDADICQPRIVQRKLNKRDVLRRLRKRLYNALFEQQKGPHSHTISSTGEDAGILDIRERFYVFAYELRGRRQFDKADRLEELVDSLPQNDHNSAKLDPVLEFLICLSNHDVRKPRNPVGHSPMILPIKTKTLKDTFEVVPSGPLYFGDCKAALKPDVSEYLYYPIDLFNGAGSELPRSRANLSGSTKIFDVTPGQDLLGNGLFNVTNLTRSSSNDSGHSSLFHGLTHSTVSSLDAKLDLPELPDHTETHSLGLRLPKHSPTECSEDDEGFHESTASSSTLEVTTETEDIWQAALHYIPNRNHTWETIGKTAKPVERPYLTEAGPEVFDELYKVRLREVANVDPKLSSRRLNVVSQQNLIKDALNVMIGVASRTFHYDKNLECFVVEPGTHLSGTSPESLSPVVQQFADMGTQYLTLDVFSRPDTMSSFYMAGLIFQAFAGELQRYLRLYQSAVLSAPRGKDVSVFLLYNLYQKWACQLRYLYELCLCDKRRGTKPGDAGDPFPTGIKLLSYIYQEALDCCHTDNYMVLLSLLRVSCGPYLMFIQDWVFDGVCKDPYREFMIRVNDEYFHFRDKYYWTNGFVLSVEDASESVPMFLRDLAKDLFITGKSINLLKLCYPEHHLCNPEVQIPRLLVTLSLEELKHVRRRTSVYVTVMNQIARLKSMSREEKEIRADLAKQQLLVTAKRTAANALQRIKDEMLREKIAADAKKRRHFKELKEEMEKYLERRATEEQQEKDEDKKRVENLLDREQEEKEKIDELEKQAREELIEYYEQLSAEATLREKRALWHVKRRRLDDARYRFFQQSEADLKVALEEKKRALEKALGIIKEEGTDSPDDRRGGSGVDPGSRPSTAILPGLPGIAVQQQRESKTDAETAGNQETEEPRTDSQQTGDAGAIDDVTAGVTTDTSSAKSVDVKSQSTELKQGKEAKQDIGTADSEASKTPTQSDADSSEAVDGSSQSPVNDDITDGKASENLIVLEDISVIEDGKANENIEDALNLVRQAPSSNVIEAKPVREAPMNLIDLSITDFLPKEPDASKEKTETSKQSADTSLDDVLIQIGSSLPTHDLSKDDRSENNEDGKPDIDDFMRHPSSSVAGDILYPGKGEFVDDGCKPSANVHGHPSDSSLFPSGGHSGYDSVRKPTPNVHGHASNAVAGDIIYSSEGKDEKQARFNIHGHPSDSALGGTLYSTVGQGDSKLAQNIHGHPSDSRFPLGVAIVDPNDLSKPRQNIHGHASDSVAGAVIYSKELFPASRSEPNIHGHASDSVLGSILYPERRAQIAEYKKTKRLLKHLNKAQGNVDSDEDDDQYGLPGLPLRSPEKLSKQQGDTPTDETVIDKGPVKFHEVVYSDGHAPGKSTERGADQDDALSPVVFVQEKRLVTGHPSDSSIQQMMYPEPSEDTQSLEPKPSREKAAGRPSLSTGYGRPRAWGGGLKSGKTAIRGLELGHRIKSLIYPELLEEDSSDEDVPANADAGRKPYEIWVGDNVEPLRDNFDILNEMPSFDLLADAGIAPISTELGDYGLALAEDDDIKASELYCLPVILKRSITASLSAQISLVNRSILDYYMVDLNTDKHLQALRHFLFLEDGEFGHSLCHQLFERLSQGARPGELLSPLSLNSILAKALQAAVYGEMQFAENLSFALKWMPPIFKRNSIDTLDCLELRYKVDWPVNIVITESSIMKYNKVFSFILQIKRAAWILRDIYFHLKRSALVNHAGSSSQFRQLQLFRHEMQHFVHVLQGYMANQVVHVSWEEFQQHLKENVHNLDDLHRCHAEYLNKAVFRSLLNKKAEVVMNIITNILCLIVKFRTQLVSAKWHYDPRSRQAVHPVFEPMKNSFRAFKDYSGFLYKVLTKLVTRGYQPHLDDFILRLNFNSFYDVQAGSSNVQQ